eukprot:10942994-Ditylum_brightwellii.AAC.1
MVLADRDTNLQVTGIGNPAFKLWSCFVAVHNTLYMTGLTVTLFLALHFGLCHGRRFTIYSRSSWFKFPWFQVPCDIVSECTMVMGTSLVGGELLNPNCVYITSYKVISSSTANCIQLST